MRSLLAAWILLSAAGIITYFFLPRVDFEAKVWLIARRLPEPLFGTRTDAADSHARFLQTQIRLVTSPDVLSDTMASHPELGRLPMLERSLDPEGVIRSIVRAEIEPGTDLITVSVVSHDLKEAKAIAEAVVESYLKAANSWASEAAQEQIHRLSEERRKLVKSIDAIRTKLERLVRRQGILEPERDHVSLERFNRFLERFDTVRLRRIELESRLESARVGAEKAAQPIPWRDGLETVIAFIAANPEFAQLSDELARARKRLETAKSEANSNGNPDVPVLQKRVGELAEKLEQLWSSLGKELLEDAMSVAPREESERRIAALDNDLIDVRTEEHALEKLPKSLVVEDRPSQDSLELELSRAELAKDEKLLDTIQDRIQQVEFDARGPQRVDRANRRTSVTVLPASSRLVMAAIPFVSLAILVPIFTLGMFLARRDNRAPRDPGEQRDPA